MGSFSALLLHPSPFALREGSANFSIRSIHIPNVQQKLSTLGSWLAFKCIHRALYWMAVLSSYTHIYTIIHHHPKRIHPVPERQVRKHKIPIKYALFWWNSEKQFKYPVYVYNLSCTKSLFTFCVHSRVSKPQVLAGRPTQWVSVPILLTSRKK